MRETRTSDVTEPETGDTPDDHAHPDDLDADSDEAGGADLLQRELGAEMIEEIPHS